MRTPATLFLSFLLIGSYAQTPGDSLYMFFDDASDDLQLDSIYPAGCWQVGTPTKTVFTSAYSPGRALVTDTVAPYADSTTCYAEFTLVATDPNYLGRDIFFMQQRDMDAGSVAYIEVKEQWSPDWHRYGTGWPENMLVNGIYQTGSVDGYSFTGNSNGWEEVWLESPCFGLMDGGGQHRPKWYFEVMQVRLVFQGGSNTLGQDGWMIDNLRAGVSLCVGGVQEPVLPALALVPNPAFDRVTITTSATNAPDQVELVAMDGRVVRSMRPAVSAQLVMELTGVAEGPYLIRTRSAAGLETAPLVVAR